ncbi:hypothetical protein ISN44_As06g028700, partial [Arabidopsis suecica]
EIFQENGIERQCDWSTCREAELFFRDFQELLENRVVQVTYGKSKADFINGVNHETALLHSR